MEMTLSCSVKAYNYMSLQAYINVVLRMVSRGHCLHSKVMGQAGRTMR